VRLADVTARLFTGNRWTPSRASSLEEWPKPTRHRWKLVRNMERYLTVDDQILAIVSARTVA
jgi:hypothetical protein